MPFARGFGPLELIIILVIVMMIFGVGKLPQVGSAMGKALREFKSSTEDIESLAGGESQELTTGEIDASAGSVATSADAAEEPMK